MPIGFPGTDGANARLLSVDGFAARHPVGL
jgi:hypothetical protein